MNFETKREQQEKGEPIDISQEEIDTYLDMNVEDPELIEWMKKKGFVFDSGMVKIRHAETGTIKQMQTNKDDFGTIEYKKEE